MLSQKSMPPLFSQGDSCAIIIHPVTGILNSYVRRASPWRWIAVENCFAPSLADVVRAAERQRFLNANCRY
jgi:hypothetical protein